MNFVCLSNYNQLGFFFSVDRCASETGDEKKTGGKCGKTIQQFVCMLMREENGWKFVEWKKSTLVIGRKMNFHKFSKEEIRSRVVFHCSTFETLVNAWWNATPAGFVQSMRMTVLSSFDESPLTTRCVQATEPDDLLCWNHAVLTPCSFVVFRYYFNPASRKFSIRFDVSFGTTVWPSERHPPTRNQWGNKNKTKSKSLPSSLLLPTRISMPDKSASLSNVIGSDGMNSLSTVGADGKPNIPEYEFHCWTEIVLASTFRMHVMTAVGFS